MPPLPDRRFGIQPATSKRQLPSGNWQRAGRAGRVFWYALCGTHACWHLAAFYDLGFFSLCAPFYAHSMAFRAVFFLCFVFYAPIILFVTPIESVTVQCLALPPTTSTPPPQLLLLLLLHLPPLLYLLRLQLRLSSRLEKQECKSVQAAR